ncbi:hypothetical protein Bca4012_030687 [Brassica carinata]
MECHEKNHTCSIVTLLSGRNVVTYSWVFKMKNEHSQLGELSIKLGLFLEGASIHQQRLKVLSKPCWIVTNPTALKPNMWCIPGDKVKALDPLPHTLRFSSPRSDAARERLSFKLLLFGSDKLIGSLRWSYLP